MTRPTDSAPPPLPNPEADARGDTSPRVVESATLLAGRSQLAILHRDAIYFLRETRLGKLILTK